MILHVRFQEDGRVYWLAVQRRGCLELHTAGRGGIETTVDQTLMRGLVTAGPWFVSGLPLSHVARVAVLYARHDRIDLVAGEDATRARVIEKWWEERQRHGEDVLIVTRRNVDAIALNRKARSMLRQDGALSQQEVVLPSIGRDDKRHDLAVSVGDKLRFGQTLPALGIRNGTRAMVEAIGPEQGTATALQLRLENGTTVKAAWSELARQRPGRKVQMPRVSHGYAGTAYSVQGRTAAATILHIGRKTDAREIYVGLTRHQHDANIVVEADRLDAGCRQRQEDRRLTPTRTAMLEHLFKDAAHYREKANVIDYVADRSAFMATGQVQLHEPEVGCILKALQAGRQLGRLIQTMRQVWMSVSRTRSRQLSRERELPAHFSDLREEVQQGSRLARLRRAGPTLER